MHAGRTDGSLARSRQACGLMPRVTGCASAASSRCPLHAEGAYDECPRLTTREGSPRIRLLCKRLTCPRPRKDGFVRFENVQKTYDGVRLVVKTLDLAIARGEFLTLLGPSGSGKTTTLMMLAGFETATHGEIFLDDDAHQQHSAAQARHRHGVPELRAVSAHDGRRKRRLPAAGARSRQAGDRRAGKPGARHGAHGRLRGARAGAALRRPAAAHRARPRTGVRAEAAC